MLCVESGGLCPTAVSCTLSPRVGLCSRWEWGDTVRQHGATICARMGPGCSVFPAGTVGPCLLCFVTCDQPARHSQRELGSPAPRGRAACTPSRRRAGTLRIPAGTVCPGSCPRSVCNQPRSRVRPGPVPAPAWKRGSGSGGGQSRGAQPGERRRQRERGGGTCPARPRGTPHPGDTGTRPRHGPAAPRPAPRGFGLRGQAGPAAGGVGRWSRW